jgi:ABC-type amino acid transport substrate-binding protein
MLMRFRVGVAGDLPGMSYWNSKTHQMEGFEADLARLLGKQLLKDANKLEFVKVLPGERLIFLQEDKVDAIISQLTITPERLKQIYFSKPYYIAKEAVLIINGSPIKDITDLKGKKVAVAEGTITLQHFKTYFPEINLVITQTESGGVQLLKNRQVDAVGNDNINLLLLKNHMEDPNQFEFLDIGNKFPVKPFGIGVRKGDTDLLCEINKILENLESDGSIQKLLEKYLCT